MPETFWEQEIQRKVAEQAAAFTVRQIASGAISKDSIAAMSGADLRNGLSARPAAVTPTEEQRKAQEAGSREADARTAHAMGKQPSQYDASDKEALRKAVTDYFKGGR